MVTDIHKPCIRRCGLNEDDWHEKKKEFLHHLKQQKKSM